MKTPRSTLRGLKHQRQNPSKYFQLDVLVLKPCVVLLSPLILSLLTEDFFTPMTPDRTEQGACGPKFSTPPLLFDRRDALKHLSGRETFDDPAHLCWAITRHGLQETMDVRLRGPEVQKDDLVSLKDFPTDVFERGITLLATNGTPVFGWTHHMGDQHGDLVALLGIFAQKSYGNTASECEWRRKLV